MVTNSKVNSYFLGFLSLSFEDSDVTREKRHAFLKLQVFQPNGRLLWGFVYVSCGQFDQWSTSWFCCSLPVLWGLQVKPPFCQSGWSRLRAMLRSWLSRTFAFFLSSLMQHFTLTCNDALCFVCFFSLHFWWSQLNEWCSVWETI